MAELITWCRLMQVGPACATPCDDCRLTSGRLARSDGRSPDTDWVVGGRRGGKQKALNDVIEKLIRAGWTEVTDEPGYGPRVDGMRKFNGPASEHDGDPETV